MKRVVIVGVDSYIGNHIRDWLGQYSDRYSVDIIDARGGCWKEYDFCGADAVVYVAGIVHRPDITDRALYWSVNVALPLEVATEAKNDGVRQFVFLSTMAVYGCEKRLKGNIVCSDTVKSPRSLYGKSKLAAEEALLRLNDADFSLIVVRPPNVYGKNCRGGYISGFRSVVSKLPVIPHAFTNAKQSMIYIDNLCAFVEEALARQVCGVFAVQDKTPVSAVELMQAIANALGNKKKTSKLCGLGVRLLQFLPIVKKAYGGVAYAEKMTDHFDNTYVVVPFEEGIRRTFADE